MPYKNKEDKAANDKKYRPRHRQKLKKEVLTYYGDGKLACVRCGYNEDLLALCLDHINGDGSQFRKEITGTGRIYQYLKNKEFPEGFQTLCFNCNAIKEFKEDLKHKT